jgi:hypothetical protein
VVPRIQEGTTAAAKPAVCFPCGTISHARALALLLTPCPHLLCCFPPPREFQVGPVGPLELGDEVHLARWLLHRLGEDYGISCTVSGGGERARRRLATAARVICKAAPRQACGLVRRGGALPCPPRPSSEHLQAPTLLTRCPPLVTPQFHPKPMKGDWNGTGAHTNYSTETMRNPGGMDAIMAAIDKLSKTHAEHISQYGTGNEQRLTGKHETCDINTFRFGVADRGSSIRIPLPVQLKVGAQGRWARGGHSLLWIRREDGLP